MEKLSLTIVFITSILGSVPSWYILDTFWWIWSWYRELMPFQLPFIFARRSERSIINYCQFEMNTLITQQNETFNKTGT